MGKSLHPLKISIFESKNLLIPDFSTPFFFCSKLSRQILRSSFCTSAGIDLAKCISPPIFAPGAAGISKSPTPTFATIVLCSRKRFFFPKGRKEGKKGGLRVIKSSHYSFTSFFRRSFTGEKRSFVVTPFLAFCEPSFGAAAKETSELRSFWNFH